MYELSLIYKYDNSLLIYIYYYNIYYSKFTNVNLLLKNIQVKLYLKIYH